MSKRLSIWIMMLGLATLVPHAKADLMFSLDQNQCCGTVNLHSLSSTMVEVTVTLGSGDLFAATGSGQHPGFAFNITGDPLIDITNIATNNSNLFTVGNTNVATNGPAFGTFDYTLNAPGNGTNAGVNKLDFDVARHAGGNLTLTDFTSNSAGYLFVADFLAGGRTAESGSLGPGGQVAAVPEPTSMALLATVVAGCLLSLRRRLSA
jgi:PEP-CTERM motif-containing protein